MAEIEPTTIRLIASDCARRALAIFTSTSWRLRVPDISFFAKFTIVICLTFSCALGTLGGGGRVSQALRSSLKHHMRTPFNIYNINLKLF